MSTSIRAIILDAIEADIPADWNKTAGLWTVTDVQKPSIWVEYSALAPAAAAPGGAVDATVDICIITQYKDMKKAEAEADEDVLVIFGACMRSQNISAVTAAKTVWEDQYLGWRVSCTVTIVNDLFTNPAETEE